MTIDLSDSGRAREPTVTVYKSDKSSFDVLMHGAFTKCQMSVF
jgi:hypothetical protein